jgi:thioesterase domain-containing protein
LKGSHRQFGAAQLQQRIDQEIQLAKHIGIVVESADDATVVLRAPLAPNGNHKGTAFGGSLYSVAVLSGWAWLTRFLILRDIAADAVIQESTMKFLAPVQGELHAKMRTPSGAEVERFGKMLKRAGRGRIRLTVDVHHQGAPAAVFEGVFAAALRR